MDGIADVKQRFACRGDAQCAMAGTVPTPPNDLKAGYEFRIKRDRFDTLFDGRDDIPDKIFRGVFIFRKHLFRRPQVPHILPHHNAGIGIGQFAFFVYQATDMIAVGMSQVDQVNVTGRDSVGLQLFWERATTNSGIDQDDVFTSFNQEHVVV